MKNNEQTRKRKRATISLALDWIWSRKCDKIQMWQMKHNTKCSRFHRSNWDGAFFLSLIDFYDIEKSIDLTLHTCAGTVVWLVDHAAVRKWIDDNNCEFGNGEQINMLQNENIELNHVTFTHRAQYSIESHFSFGHSFDVFLSFYFVDWHVNDDRVLLYWMITIFKISITVC